MRSAKNNQGHLTCDWYPSISFFTGGLTLKVNPILVRLLTVAVIAVALLPAIGHGALQTGSQVPVFTLKDVNGKAYPLSGMKHKAMTILYFFDPDSRPSI